MNDDTPYTMEPWARPEDDYLQFPEPRKEPVKIDVKADRKFSKIVSIIFLIIFLFIYGKALFGQPEEQAAKYPGSFPDPKTLPADCRYPGLTVKY